MSEKFDVEFLKWSLDARAAVQAALLNLAVFGDSQRIKLGDHAPRFCALAGVAFSLWRAAFLAGMAARPHLSSSVGKAGAQVEHALDIVRKVVATNAISFMDDLRAQFWVGQYYIDNAGYRLDEYLMKWSKKTAQQAEDDFYGYWHMADADPDFVESARGWIAEYNLLIKYITELGEDLHKEAPVQMLELDIDGYNFEPKPASIEDFFV